MAGCILCAQGQLHYRAQCTADASSIHYAHYKEEPPMPTCDKCARGEPHKRRHCNDPANTKFCALCAANRVHFDCLNDEEVPVYEIDNTQPLPTNITRIDRYTLSVHGVYMNATPEQEERIRKLTPEQVENLLTIMGRGNGPRITLHHSDGTVTTAEHMSAARIHNPHL